MALQTPVALFVFNRPQLTQQLMDRVRRQRPERLLVVADGPRPDRAGEAVLCDQTRAIVDQVDWPCRVQHAYSDVNLGCKARVSSGLDWVFDEVPEAIILEDDCLPSPSFFGFAETLLARYRDDDRVAMIAGSNHAPATRLTSDYVFSRYFSIWGWAGWARAWRDFDLQMTAWPALRALDTVRRLYPDPGLGAYLTACFDQAHAGAIDTWDLQWFFSCLAAGRLCVAPSVNLVTNLGFEGTRPPTRGMGLPAGELDSRAERRPPAVLPDLDYELGVWREHLHADPTPRVRERALGAAYRLSARVRRR